MERRSFFDWVKCPIEFSREFNYVRFQSDRPKQIHKYVGFSENYKEHWQVEIKIILNFAQVYSDDNGGIRISEHTKGYMPGWYNKAEHLTEKEVIKILNEK